jgi:hypothetical protein
MTRVSLCLISRRAENPVISHSKPKLCSGAASMDEKLRESVTPCQCLRLLLGFVANELHYCCSSWLNTLEAETESCAQVLVTGYPLPTADFVDRCVTFLQSLLTFRAKVLHFLRWYDNRIERVDGIDCVGFVVGDLKHDWQRIFVMSL